MMKIIMYRAFHNVLRVTNIYNNNSCSQPQANWKSFFLWQLEMCSMCAPRVTRHTSIRYSSFSHTRVNISQHGHYIHSHRLAAEKWNVMKNNLLWKKFLSCSFYLYRFRKYVSYDFLIINFFNPGVHYETPCIITTVFCVMTLCNLVDKKLHRELFA
jgi:hypothetical protein